ncbi:HesA/MoeB/ThiF family protein [Neotabrizicola sp. sgz301269]|uniref:HesA/MoeB/ThiF family protein n=1 Tax=Neotabrizicola sp. sgz301269 TaxID=3276282 RepID=UPI00376F8205
MIGLLGFAAIWGLSRWFGWPRALALGLIALWWAFLVLATAPHIGAPGLAATLGGDFRLWVLLGALAVLVAGYLALLSRLKARAAPAKAPAASGSFSPAELDRYARHILLREIGGPGQKALKGAKVLVVGAGGLGAPALLYLAASGVGRIGVIDPDVVESSNLQRQVIHSEDRVGMPKVFSAQQALQALNPFIEILPYHRWLDEKTAKELIADYDLVLDGTDNFDTRYLVNRICAALGKPLIAGAITQWEGQLSLWHPASGGPCYACVFPVRPAPGMVPTCAEAGVASPLPGVIGAMMAMEAVKHLTGAGETLTGRLMIHDALYAETRTITVKKRPDCPVCGSP